MAALTKSITRVLTHPSKLVQLDANGRLPALDARNLTRVADQLLRDNTAMNAFISWLAAGRASGPVPNGYMHLFLTDELATKTNATYDAANKLYTNQTAATQIPQATGTAIGNMSDGGGLAAAFDSNESQAYAACASTATEPAIIGKDYGAGNSYIFDHFVFISSNNSGFSSVPTPSVTINVYGTTNGGTTGGTLIGTLTFTDTESTLTKTITSTDLTTAYRGWYAQIAATGSTKYICEAKAWAYNAATNMTLIPAAVTAGAAPASVDLYLLHKPVVAVTLNTDIKARVSRDNGSNWSAHVTLAEVCQYDTDYKLLKGTADMSALASGTSVKWEITTLNTKDQLVRAALAWFE